uniref:Uncharacterized protein LOC111106722 n=1 Tax=Crassostrea virginica TaxID=6565 RepID=A0A8B8B1C9_CRAVI|nr:uncharacterized protein LOC111106722 [Crassostrea virginica]
MCSLTLKTAEDFLENEYNTCRSKCNVKIYSPGWYMNSKTVYPLRRITVYFGDKLASENRCANSQYESQMLVNCSSWKHDDYLIRDGRYCEENGAYCTYIEHTCICQCLPGYFKINGRCLLDAQGSTSAHASTLGLLFGGFFLGALSTVGIVFIIYRRFKSSLISRTEPCVLFTENVNSLETAARFHHSEPKNTQQEVINSAPHEPSEYCNVSNKRGRQLIISDVSNPLYEGEEREESDNYDHVCAATFEMRDSNLQRNDHIPISSDEMKVDTDNYSIIKL